MTSSGSHPNAGEFARGSTVFARRVIDRCVRRDRLASVFAAHDSERPHEWFTICSVRGDQVTRAAGVSERFGHEMGRVRDVRSPSLAEVVDWESDGDAPVVLSAMHRGRSLRDVIASEPFLGVEDVARIVVTVAEALTVLHQALPSITHLGVCPERVVVGDDGGVWLEEPGFLHALINSGYLSTQQAVAHAQPGYIIPAELLAPPSPAADVYQLAVLAFEALTGQLPFGAATQADLPLALRAPLLPSASALRPGVLPDIDDVFDRVWRGALLGGHDSVLAFARDLARVLGEDRSLRPTFPGEAALDPVRRGGRVSPGALLDDVRPRRVSIVHGTSDGVDTAFDDMLRDDVTDVHVPPVIEFTPAGLHLEPAIVLALAASAPVVDVTSVKPTLVGATGIRLSTHPPPPHGPTERRALPRPPVEDQSTPSVGYERIKLLTHEAELLNAPAARPDTARSSDVSPDATSQIEQELLEVLRRTGSSGRNGSAPRAPAAQGPAQRARSLDPNTIAPRKDDVPPPPTNTTRPSATPLRPRAPQTAEASHASTTSTAKPADIPPPPRLPSDARAMYEGSQPPPLPPSGRAKAIAASSPPEVSLVESPAEESSAELSMQDLVEEVIPALARHGTGRPPALPHAVAATLHDEHHPSSADRTHLTGSPLPPRPSPPTPPAASHRPDALPPPTRLASVESVSAPRPPTHAREAAPSPQTPPAIAGAPPSAPMLAHSVTPTAGPMPAAPRASAAPESLVRPAPEPAPQSPDPSWTVAAHFLGTSTIVASLLVTAGLVYMRSSLESLREEVARYRVEAVDAGAPALFAPPESEPDASLPELPDVAIVLTPDVVAPDADASVTAVDVSRTLPARARAVAGDAGAVGDADPTAVPSEAVRVRLMGQMRSGINDCIEGVDNPRMVVINVRFDGVMGLVQHVRLHGIFAEPPLGPCIEEVVRRAQVTPFTAPAWETVFRFPVPQPRWRPPM